MRKNGWFAVFLLAATALIALPACSLLPGMPFEFARTENSPAGDTSSNEDESPADATPTPTVSRRDLPDLVYVWYSVSYDDCPWGGPGSIKAHIRNEGRADAGTFHVTIDGETTRVESLAAGQETDAVVRFAAGPIGYVEIEIDSRQEVAEKDEENNIFHIVFTPPPPCETVTP